VFAPAFALAAALQSPAPSPVPTGTSVPAAAIPSYRYLDDEENWRSFCSPTNRPPGSQNDLKCITLANDPKRYVTLGADLRFKYEHFFNKDWNPSNSGYLLERELLDADVHEDRVRGFLLLEHATATNQHAPVDATWRDDFATSSAYLEYDLGGATGAAEPPIQLRYGRQLLAYGSERMIDDRSGLNTLAAFGGFRARFASPHWQTDVFVVRPVTVNAFGFDDTTDNTKSFTGAYATRRIGANALDFYGFVDQRRSQSYYRGTGPEVRETLGVRYATSSPSFDSDTELDKQFGSFGGATIDSYAIEGNYGYDFGRNLNRFRLGAGGGIASGDHNLRSSRFSLFRAPYPTGLTFGIIEANGNDNTSGFTPNASYTYDRRITVAVKDYFFYRQSIADGVYSAPGFALRAPQGSHAAPLGSLGYVSVADALDRHVTLYSAYARYLIGQFFEQAPAAKGVPSRSTAYYNLWFDYKI